MISVGLELKGTSLKEETKELFQRAGLASKDSEIAEQLATLLLGRVMRRFSQQKNPDGSKWEETEAAKTRKAGGYTFAQGGQYSPGSIIKKPRKWRLTDAEKVERKWKTGGNTLASSYNLQRSIQLVDRGGGTFAIQTDVPYAQYWQNDQYTIIGTSENEVDNFLTKIFDKIL